MGPYRGVLVCRDGSCLHCFVVPPYAFSRCGVPARLRLSFIPSQPLRWIVVVVSAASSGICEETGFRGFMQWPIEKRHGTSVAIFISSLSFLALHLTKAWASLGLLPIVFGAGVLLGLSHGPPNR